MNKQEEGRYQAGITVFLSLMLVVMISFLGTFLESAHLAAVRSQTAAAGDSAMDNLFSYYEKSLYEKYRILALDERQPAETILQADMNWYQEGEQVQNYLRFKAKETEITEKQYLLDNNGEALYKEAAQIVSADVIAAVKQMLSEQTEDLSQSAVFTENMNLLTQQSSNLVEISDILEEIDICIETYNHTLLQLKEHLRSVSLEEYVKSAVNPYKIESYVDQLLEESKNIKKYVLDYHQKRQAAAAAVSTVQNALNRDELDQRYKDILYDELKAIQELTSKDGKIYQSVEELNQQIQKQIYPLERMKKVSKTGSAAEEGYSILKENIRQCKELSKISLKKVEKQENHTDIKISQLFKLIKEAADEGVLGLVLDDSQKLSERKVTTRNLPSEQTKKETTNTKNLFRQKIEGSINNFVWNIYLEQYFDCFTDGGTYDLEYVLGGKKTDKENLKNTAEQLVLLRQAMNLVQLLEDESKKLQAQSTAGVLFAFTANPTVIQAMSTLIMAAWAYAEAISDVRILMYGGKIPFWKNKSQWRMSLDDAVNIKKWKVPEKEIKSSKNGLSYSEYLRILLFFHGRDNNLYRGCDMIQWNICQKDSAFRLSSCIYDVKARFKVSVSPLFVSMQQMLWGNEYIYEHAEQKSYS